MIDALNSKQLTMISVFCLKIIFFILLIMQSSISKASDYFDPSLLESVNGKIPTTNLSGFSDHHQLPGDYIVKININSEYYGQRREKFISDPSGILVPCFTKDEYLDMGVDFNSELVDKSIFLDKSICSSPSKAIKGAVTQFDFSVLQLELSLPQLALRSQVQDEIPEDQWDEGITAFMSDYRFDGSTIQTKVDNNSSDTNESDGFLSWHNGFNQGAWRLRNYSSWSNSDGWTSLQTYAERSVHSLKSELTLGDFSTQPDIFDSLSLRGVELASDTQMLPASIDGFAPIVRGIAKSYAQVTVKNDGNIIYQANVPPGPFALTNVVPVSDGGVLDVTIKESDGSENQYSIPYATVPLLQREGQLNYSLSLGKYRQGDSSQRPNLAQATAAYGLPFDLTFISGVQFSNEYRSISYGLGVDGGSMGALSLTVIQGHAIPVYSRRELAGKALRLSYAKEVAASDTTIQADEKIFSGSYLSFQDSQESDKNNQPARNQQSVNISQPLANTGENLYFTLSRTGYENSSDKLYQAGISGSAFGATYSISLSESLMAEDSQWDKQISLNISIPFSVFSSLNNNEEGSVSYVMTHGGDGSSSQQVSVSDSLNDDKTFSYTASAAYSNDGSTGAGGSLNLDNKNNIGEGYIGYDYDHTHRQTTYGVSGGVLVHRGGVTLSQYMDSASALISIPKAKNISVGNSSGITTDSQGYAVVPNIMPYRKNEINVTPPSGQNSIVDITNLTETVIPTKDAIVIAKFNANIGRKIIVMLKTTTSPLPFGTRVTIDDNKNTFYVADKGIVYLTGVPDKGILTAELDEGKYCKASFTLPEHTNGNKRIIDRVSLLCR